MKKLSFHQAIEELKPSSVRKKIDTLIEWNIPASKIVLGVLFGGLYGLEIDQTNDELINLGIQPYTLICYTLLNLNATVLSSDYNRDDELAFVRYASLNKTFKTHYISSRSIANLMRFGVKRQLAGAFVYTILNDDYHGLCSDEKTNTDSFVDFVLDEGITLIIPERKNIDFPLMRVVNDAIMSKCHGFFFVIDHCSSI